MPDHEQPKTAGLTRALTRRRPDTAPAHALSGGGGAGAALRQVQRVAGNRGLGQLVAGSQRGARPGGGPAPVQRQLATKPSDFDKFLGMGATVKGAFGKLTVAEREFTGIRDALSVYQTEHAKAAKGKRAEDLDWQDGLLGILEVLCMRWLTNYPKDKKRKAFVDELQVQVSFERAAIGKLRAQKVYQQNVLNAGKVDPKTGQAADAHSFKGMDQYAKMITKDLKKGFDEQGRANPSQERADKIKLLQSQHGITNAEISGIRIFSAGDYAYINPVTRGSASSLAWEKSQQEQLAELPDQTLKEEGSLHAALVLEGLAKLPPYAGEIFRGARYTPKEFGEYCAIGHVFSYGQLTSFTSKKEVAYNFAHGIDTSAPAPEKNVAVIFIGADTGKDISDIAFKKAEWEVLVEPSANFEVVSQQEVDGNSEFAEQMDQIRNDQRKPPLPTKWYFVKIARTTKKPPKKAPAAAPAKPASQWKSGGYWKSAGMPEGADAANRGVGSGGVKPGLLPLEGGRGMW